jgi:hypothetical protein
MLNKLFRHDKSLIYRWIREAEINLKEPSVDEEIKEIEFDEM